MIDMLIRYDMVWYDINGTTERSKWMGAGGLAIKSNVR